MQRSERAAQARRELDRKLAAARLDPIVPPPRSGWIRAIRGALGMSQQAFTARLGISAWIHRRSTPEALTVPPDRRGAGRPGSGGIPRWCGHGRPEARFVTGWLALGAAGPRRAAPGDGVQVTSGSVRRRSKHASHGRAHGQSAGRCKVRRRPLVVRRPGIERSWRRTVLATTSRS
jgi:hypothetical protein